MALHDTSSHFRKFFASNGQLGRRGLSNMIYLISLNITSGAVLEPIWWPLISGGSRMIERGFQECWVRQRGKIFTNHAHSLSNHAYFRSFTRAHNLLLITRDTWQPCVRLGCIR